MRRYEILLPEEFNDGRLVADRCPRCLPESLTEAADVFGAFTFRPESALGTWTAPNQHRYRDRLSVLSVDVDDSPAHAEWIRHFKSHLLQRFQQLEIYITSYPVEVV
ncbi:hypothetical protein [Microlunatus ginsengisoli]|uniref:DUF4286 family protein n=1 Tax=Microlunatus ginsengisoli TaxID=363863 RepID=A0ABP7ARA4_9ACTN